MSYTRADVPHPRGEVCVRGPTVFQGYYKDDAQVRDGVEGGGGVGWGGGWGYYRVCVFEAVCLRVVCG